MHRIPNYSGVCANTREAPYAPLNGLFDGLKMVL